MTSTYRSRAADQRIVEEVGAQQDLKCTANGCPNRWSVDAGNGKLCSWHAWSEPHLWPQITQEQQDAVTERVYRAQYKQPPEHKPMTQAEKMQTLRSLRDAVEASSQVGRREWARRIVDRSEAGARISPLVLRIAREVVAKESRRSA